MVEDAAADGVVWVQPHFDPYAYPDFGPAEEVLELALAAGYEAAARHGVGFGLTLAAMRHHGPKVAADLARFAARHAAESDVLHSLRCQRPTSGRSARPRSSGR